MTLLSAVAFGLCCLPAEGAAVNSAGPERQTLLAVAEPGVANAAQDADGIENAAAAERMLADITLLASPEFAGRSGDAAAKAADWVGDRFAALGLEPLFEATDESTAYQQLIPGSEVMIPGINVAGVLRGSERPDEYVFVAAHHDHLGIRRGRLYPGADDNASGTAMVVEAARRLTAKPQRPQRTIVFITFDLEENLLWGSRYFVANSPIPMGQIQAFLVADMIGRHLGDLDLDEVFVMGSESAAGLTDLIGEQAAAAGQPIATLGVDIIGTRSDYGPFRSKRVPFAFFSTGEHPDYHQPTDTPDKIDAPRAARIARTIAESAWAAANRDQRLQWGTDVPDGVREAAILAKISDLLMAEHESGENVLPVVELLLVSRMQTEAKAIVAAGRITPSQRKWLVRGAQAMMISIF